MSVEMLAVPKPPTGKLDFYEEFMISGVSACISKTCAAPIERVKLLIQNQDELIKQGTLNRRYSGVRDCMRRVLNTDGLVSLWRGNLANVLRYFPTQAFNFAFNDAFKTAFDVRKSDGYAAWFAANVVSGGMAGASTLVFVYTLDYARTRLANDVKSAGAGSGKQRQFHGILDVYVKTLRSDGFAGLYRGFGVSCAGIAAYRGCYFGLYDSLKVLLPVADSFALNFALGWAVTVVAGLVSYPLDTVRRRMMMTSGAPTKYRSAFDCAKQIVRGEGAMSLMKGAGANILRGIAGAGVLAGVDYIKPMYVEIRLREELGRR